MRVRYIVNYKRLLLFMSFLAHEKKRLGYIDFIKVYSKKRYIGIYKKYLQGYMLYLKNKKDGIVYTCKKVPKFVVLGVIDYDEYFKRGNKEILQIAIDNCIPELLQFGFVLDSVQVAVGDT